MTKFMLIIVEKSEAFESEDYREYHTSTIKYFIKRAGGKIIYNHESYSRFDNKYVFKPLILVRNAPSFLQELSEYKEYMIESGLIHSGDFLVKRLQG